MCVCGTIITIYFRLLGYIWMDGLQHITKNSEYKARERKRKERCMERDSLPCMKVKLAGHSMEIH